MSAATVSVGLIVTGDLAAVARLGGPQAGAPAPTVHRSPLSDPTGGLADGSVDVAFVRTPFAAPGLDVLPLAQEDRLVALPEDHPLAARDFVTTADLAGEDWVHVAGDDAVWGGTWALERRGTVRARTPDELLGAVAAGAGIALVPAALRQSESTAGLVFRPVRDLAPLTVALAWRRGDDRPEVRDFVDAVQAVCDGDPLECPLAVAA
jgi:DNA-binding transcriptional LysR family regulator